MGKAREAREKQQKDSGKGALCADSGCDSGCCGWCWSWFLPVLAQIERWMTFHGYGQYSTWPIIYAASACLSRTEPGSATTLHIQGEISSKSGSLGVFKG
ncbi:uncharacterized protein MCYG_00497 [Microsporum canis CBS 113480]|uniref:Uncharacterized protein n=1 Tax=Arthroderma otae (strain ATCC MYA-4605 / CBS 113480) TaxID=554155 RepID=C5FCS5_ARTOC|nr:uncharacterized protein MCYG_00497 [Microsporum canis CBS 113480]EEQ27609.1 predicted protein [Microsporum canis CBS 113480]